MLYDLYMSFRFRRSDARKLNAFAAMNRLASIWHDQDGENRAGRISWQAPKVVYGRYPAITVKRGRV